MVCRGKNTTQLSYRPMEIETLERSAEMTSRVLRTIAIWEWGEWRVLGFEEGRGALNVRGSDYDSNVGFI